MAADGYGMCDHCGWVGKLRADGTLRKHRRRTGGVGDAKQDPTAPTCTGSGQPPYDIEGEIAKGYKVSLDR